MPELLIRDFVQAIEDAVGQADVLLTIIGKNWASGAGGGGALLQDTTDNIRLEVETALDREFREELGIGVEIVRPYGEIRYRDRSGRDLEVRFFLARRVSGRPRPVEVAAVEWVDSEALTGVDFIPANKEIVTRLVEDIREGRVRGAD